MKLYTVKYLDWLLNKETLNDSKWLMQPKDLKLVSAGPVHATKKRLKTELDWTD